MSMLTTGILTFLSLSMTSLNSGLTGGLKLKPNRASTTRLYESLTSCESGRKDRKGTSISWHCLVRFWNRGLFDCFG
uniref:Putative secreted protein n=1 Tax=Ixodes ricinus TaxID=34613 RepID=A0A6B0U4J1_IXORI